MVKAFKFFYQAWELKKLNSANQVSASCGVFLVCFLFGIWK